VKRGFVAGDKVNQFDMKKIEIFDSDCEALEILSKVHDCDVKTTVSDLVNMGIKTYAAQIAAWREEQGSPKAAKVAVCAKKPAKKSSADKHYEQALALAKVKGKICCADIQRTLCLSYTTAATILDRLINDGVVEQGATKSSWVWRE